MKKKTPQSLNQKAFSLLEKGDPLYNQWYDEGLKRCGMEDNVRRRPRFYNLVQLFDRAIGLEGDVAECGTWHGLSAYLLCQSTRRREPAFRGEGLHLFDSFRGLPAPSTHDEIPAKRAATLAGKFSASLEAVKNVLSEFPEISYYPGWIPQTFGSLDERKYRFVHVDVDLYESTRDAIRYFYPRLSEKGILVCDDYSSWAGAKRAVDEFADENGVRVLLLSTGQAVILNAYSEKVTHAGR